MATQYSEENAKTFNVKLINDEYKLVTKKYDWECLECKNIFSMSWDYMRTTFRPCNFCGSQNQDESLVRHFLRFVFGEEYFFNTVRPDFLQTDLQKIPLELDGYEESLALAFEYQGLHHYQDKVYEKTSLEEVQKKDAIKKEICEKNGITLLVIPYFSRRLYEGKIQKLKNILLKSNKYPPGKESFLRGDETPVFEFKAGLLKWQLKLYELAEKLGYKVLYLPTIKTAKAQITCKNNHLLEFTPNYFLRCHVSCRKCNIRQIDVENVLAIARKYKTRKEFSIKESNLYQLVRKHNLSEILDQVWPKKRKEYTDELLIGMSKKYKSPFEWEKDDRNGYTAATSREQLWEKIKETWPKKPAKEPPPPKIKKDYHADYLVKLQTYLSQYNIICHEIYLKNERRVGLFESEGKKWEQRVNHLIRRIKNDLKKKTLPLAA
jgi:hypothetical protein